jgi:hypothetical protein
VEKLISLSPIVEYALSVAFGHGGQFRNPYPNSDNIVDPRDQERYCKSRQFASAYITAQKMALDGIKKIRGSIFGVILGGATIDHVESNDFLERVIKKALENSKDEVFHLLSGVEEIRPKDTVSFAARVLQRALYDPNPEGKLRIRVNRDLRRDLLSFRVKYTQNVGGLSAFLGAFLSALGFRARCFISESSHEGLRAKFKDMNGVEFIQSGAVVKPEVAVLDPNEPGNLVCKTKSINFLDFFSKEDLTLIPTPLNGSRLSIDVIVSSDEGIPDIINYSPKFLEELSKEVPVYFLSSVNKARTIEEINKFFDVVRGIQSRFSWSFSSFVNWEVFGAGVPRFRERVTTVSLNSNELLDIVKRFIEWFPNLPEEIENKSEIEEKFTKLGSYTYDIQSCSWLVNGLDALQALFGDQVNVVLRGHYLNLSSYPKAERFSKEDCDALRDVSLFSRALAAQKVYFSGGMPKSIDQIGVVDFPFTVNAVEQFQEAAYMFRDAREDLEAQYWAKINDRLIILIPTMPFRPESGTAGAGDTIDFGRVLATQALLGDKVDARLS